MVARTPYGRPTKDMERVRRLVKAGAKVRKPRYYWANPTSSVLGKDVAQYQSVVLKRV